ncbi:hypothetical protein C0584_06205 [Candidatus Parcubacteria bacterium]|nr:MAG: hypothetical protein C0584_06205 [Candidatus Parcubacteria bacterium]
MKKIFSKTFLPIFIALFLFSPFLSLQVNATALQEAKNKMQTSADTAKLATDAASSNISSKVGSIIGIVLSFVGVIFLILIIYAGFTWMLARGNESEVLKAKNLMYDAVIGLIIIMAAYAITAFVGSKIAK